MSGGYQPKPGGPAGDPPTGGTGAARPRPAQDTTPGLMEPRAEQMREVLHRLALGEHEISGEVAAGPMLMSIAVSLKRIADRLESMTGENADGTHHVDVRNGDQQ